MAETLLQVYADIARHIGADPSISAFAETDESSDLVQFIFEAYRVMRRKMDPRNEYFKTSGTLSLVASTRAYNIASDAEPQGVFTWSVENETDNDTFLQAATKEYIQREYPKYDEDTGVPNFFYFDGGQMAFYPIPDDSYTVKYEYRKEITENTATSTTFDVSDDQLDFVKKYTQFLWEKKNGFGDPEATRAEAMDILHGIKVEMWRMNPTTFRSRVRARGNRS